MLLDGALDVELALFLSKYSDFQAIDTTNDDTSSGSLSVTLNPGEIELHGFEWTTKYRFSKYFSVGFSGHYIDTEFTKISSTIGVYEIGDEADYTSKNSYSVNLRYDYDIYFGGRGFALIDFSKQGKYRITNRTRAIPIIQSDDISLVNVQVGAEWDALTIRIFGRNINNEQGLTSPVLGSNFIQNRPRTWGVNLSYRY